MDGWRSNTSSTIQGSCSANYNRSVTAGTLFFINNAFVIILSATAEGQGRWRRTSWAWRWSWRLATIQTRFHFYPIFITCICSSSTFWKLSLSGIEVLASRGAFSSWRTRLPLGSSPPSSQVARYDEDCDIERMSFIGTPLLLYIQGVPAARLAGRSVEDDEHQFLH